MIKSGRTNKKSYLHWSWRKPLAPSASSAVSGASSWWRCEQTWWDRVAGWTGPPGRRWRRTGGPSHTCPTVPRSKPRSPSPPPPRCRPGEGSRWRTWRSRAGRRDRWPGPRSGPRSTGLGWASGWSGKCRSTRSLCTLTNERGKKGRVSVYWIMTSVPSER